MGLIRFIFYLLFIWFIIRLLARLFMPIIIQKVVQKAGNQFNRQYGQPDAPRRPEGSIEVDYVPPAAKKKTDTKDGEFVDYEEVN